MGKGERALNIAGGALAITTVVVANTSLASVRIGGAAAADEALVTAGTASSKVVAGSSEAPPLPKSKPPACFPAGTPVQMAGGSAVIESIGVGDQIRTRSIGDGSEIICRVAKVFEHDYIGEFVTLTLESGDITATGNHPFWVLQGESLAERPMALDAGPDQTKRTSLGARWVSATDLRSGDLTWTDSGPQAILKISRQIRVEKVYNLKIASEHTYLVGYDGVLVHNKMGPDDFAGGAVPEPGPPSAKTILVDPNDARQLYRESNYTQADINKYKPFDAAKSSEQPIRMVETPDGRRHVVEGNRRTAAAAEEGKKVPAQVIPLDLYNETVPVPFNPKYSVPWPVKGK
jgi:hypothetical protein